MFKAILLSKSDAGFDAKLTELDDGALPEGDVTVRVEFSTVNYKDGLAITNKSPVVRKWPMVPGIDLAGTVEATSAAAFAVGSRVVLNGWGVGEAHWGGLAQKARLKASWLIPLPASMTSRQAMSIGTAGYTAMLCVLALEKHGVKPEHGEVLVTGAAGGVGSVAVALLAAKGFKVVASTRRMGEEPYLKSLGASELLDAATLSAQGKPLARERWAGVVDTVGSHTLVNACAAMKYRGVVTACWLAQGMDFPATVAPFILRGVTLVGIDSVMAPQGERIEAWNRLATDLDPARLASMTTEISLAQSLDAGRDIVAGKIRGRVVVDVNR